LRFSADWRNRAANAAPEERATVADLRIFVAEQNVTLHLVDDGNIDHVTIALYTLADGLAHNWWRLFGGRDREISLMDFRSGFVVPDVRMSFDGATLEVSARQRVYDNPPVRFWVGPSEVMTRDAAEAALTGFVDEILARLDAREVVGTSAALRWERVQASRADPEEAAFCEAAGALGLDPYQIGDVDTHTIEDASELFEGEPLTELLAGAANTNRGPLLDWIHVMERRRSSASHVAELADLARAAAAVAPPRPAEKSWALGYRRARAMRAALQLGQQDRFKSFRPLAEKLGARKTFDLARPVDGIRALRSDKPDGVHIHMRSFGSSPTAPLKHLFNFARAVGDAACFPEESRAPINELQSAYRQAAGRAFAAEFLAPIDEVKSMQRDRRDVDSIAAEFGVSTTTIERQIENTARIEAVCA
jgi:hypothetical protein